MSEEPSMAPGGASDGASDGMPGVASDGTAVGASDTRATTSADPAQPQARMSAVVLTYNEERHLPDCLSSLTWADEVLVLDSGSQDATREIAEAAGARVEIRPFENYSIQRQHALTLAKHPWLLFVDADERVSEALAAEVRTVIARPAPAPVGYWIPRSNLFFGRALKGGGWWPDHQLRLLRVDAASYDARRQVHEVAELQGDAEQLNEHLVHINYETLPEFLKKQEDYAHLDLRKRAALGERVRPHNLVLQPLREGWRRYKRLGGWRDGALGLLLAGLMALVELRTLIGLLRYRRSLPNPDR
jgi:glycosyltransferase involved in cell wall biosynthesis